MPTWARLLGGAVLIAILFVALEGAPDTAQTSLNGIVTGTYFTLSAVGRSC